MLSTLEQFFISLLRGTIITTAFFSFLATLLALLYAGYAEFSPMPTVRLSMQTDQFRNSTDPAGMLREIFPRESDVVAETYKPHPPEGLHETTASNEELFDTFNKFLNQTFDASFESKDKFIGWLYGPNALPLQWSRSIDDATSNSLDNVNQLWRVILLDYAKRLNIYASVLATDRKKNLYPDAFDKLTAPTNNARAPYFLAYFFQHMQKTLTTSAADLSQQIQARQALKLTVPIALYVAGASFSYFILIMFLFLMVSVEASVRRIAEA